MPRLTTYREDLTKGGWLSDDDVTTKFIHDTLPTNSQIFGATAIANVLTTRTVNNFTDFASPFGRVSHDSAANEASR